MDADDGALLGLVHTQTLTRDKGRKAARHAPVKAKESQRWLDGADRASLICAEASEITVVADRESDIYAAFARRPANVHLLVRAAQDRALEEGQLLFAALDAEPEAARVDLDLPAAPGRPQRNVRLAIRFKRVEIKRPANGLVQGLPKTLTVNVVERGLASSKSISIAALLRIKAPSESQPSVNPKSNQTPVNLRSQP